MPGIFISYRRDDTSGHAGHLYRDLTQHLGRDRVFMDIDTLQPGLDFAEALDRAVNSADVLLALIGPRWHSVTDAEGRRRLENPEDFVRREVATALARDDIRVIPVLVGGAGVPKAAELPEPLRPLSRRNAFEISDERWDFDVGRLVKTLEPLVKPSGGPQGGLERLRRRKFVAIAASLLGGGLAAILAWVKVREQGPPVSPVVGHETPAIGSLNQEVAFGNVPTPAFEARPIELSLRGEDRSISKPEGQGQQDLGPRQVKGVVLHRMYGTLRGTDQFLRDPETAALVDYGVGTVGTDDAADDGMIFRWNDPEGQQSGWANGPYTEAEASEDARAFVSQFGVGAINRDLVSIEISGLVEDPISEKAIEAVAGLCAYWADRVGIPWDTYPLNPTTGLPFVYWHNEFAGIKIKVCPGQVVMEATPQIEARTKEILQRYQV